MTKTKELSLIKRFDKLEVLSQAGVLSSMARPTESKHPDPVSFGLTPLLVDLERLAVDTVKRKSKDDFDLNVSASREVACNRTLEGILARETVNGTLEDTQQHGTVRRQLHNVFNASPSQEDRILPCKCWYLDLADRPFDWSNTS